MALIQKIIKNRKEGYTILEVMIVLSVSALIFTVVIAGYKGQSSKTQFTNAVRDMENKIQDILNDVSTGYYPNASNFNCTRVGSPGAHINIDPSGTAEQGTNQDCIFLGKAVDINDGAMTAYTIVGLRNSKDDNNESSDNIEDAANRIVPPTISGASDDLALNASIHIEGIVTDALADSAGFALVSGFGNGDLGGAGATTSQVTTASINPAYNFSSGTGQVVGNTDLSRDITICIKEAGTGPGEGRQASIKIGAGGQTNIETMIDGWAPECNSL